MATTLKPPPRFLTDDEVVEFHDQFGTTWPVRVRIWRGKDIAAVVLVSQCAVNGEPWPIPGYLTSKIASFVNEAMLYHPMMGILYFEDEYEILSQVYFQFFGNSHRLKLFSPTRAVVEWGDLERALGGAPIERKIH